MTTAQIEASLRRADDLIAEHRLLEALDLLSDSNRQHRDSELEERLVLLRREAFSELEHSRGRTSWPPELDDPFEGVDDLIEIQGTDISLQAVGGAIRHHGHVLVRGLLPRPTVDRLVDAIDRAFEAREAHRQGAPAAETSPWFVPIPNHPLYPAVTSATGVERFSQSKVMVVDSPRALFEVAEAFRECRLHGVVSEYLGDRPVMAENKWTLRRMSHEESRAPWHQEASVFRSGPLRTVNVWLTLSACGANAPGFRFVPRRVDSVIEPELRFGLKPKTVASLAEGGSIVSPTYEPGDAVLFDEYLVHQTKAGPEMRELRYSIESWMFAPSGHPRRKLLAPVVL